MLNSSWWTSARRLFLTASLVLLASAHAAAQDQGDGGSERPFIDRVEVTVASRAPAR